MADGFKLDEFIAKLKVLDSRSNTVADQLRDAWEKNDVEKIKSQAKQIQQKLKNNSKAKSNKDFMGALSKLAEHGTTAVGPRGLTKGATTIGEHARDAASPSAVVLTMDKSESSDEYKMLEWYAKALYALKLSVEEDNYGEIKTVTTYPAKCLQSSVKHIICIQQMLSERRKAQEGENSRHFLCLEKINKELQFDDPLLPRKGKSSSVDTAREKEGPNEATLLEKIKELKKKMNEQAIEVKRLQEIEFNCKTLSEWMSGTKEFGKQWDVKLPQEIVQIKESFERKEHEWTSATKIVDTEIERLEQELKRGHFDDNLKDFDKKSKSLCAIASIRNRLKDDQTTDGKAKEQSGTIDNEVQRLENELKREQFGDDLKDFDKRNKGLCAIASMRHTLKTNQVREAETNALLSNELKNNENDESLKQESDNSRICASTIDNEVQLLENELKRGQFGDDLKEFDKKSKGLCAIASMRTVLRENQMRNAKANERLSLEQKHHTELAKLREHLEAQIGPVKDDDLHDNEEDNDIKRLQRLFQKLSETCERLQKENENLVQGSKGKAADGSASGQPIPTARQASSKPKQRDDKEPKQKMQEQKDIEELLVDIRKHLNKEKNMMSNEHPKTQEVISRIPLEKALHDILEHQQWLEGRLLTKINNYTRMENCLLEIYKFQNQGSEPNISTEKLCESVGEQFGKLIRRKNGYDKLHEDLQRLLDTLDEESSTEDFQRRLEELQLTDNAVSSIVDIVLRRFTRMRANASQRLDSQVATDAVLRKKIKELEDDNNDLLLRLSKFAGAQLMKDNADIADLSDPNRPTKLGEKYSQLYDNMYTEAFEVLDQKYGMKEPQIVGTLLGILKEAYGLCCKYSKDQSESIIWLLHCPGGVPKKEPGRSGRPELPTPILPNAIQNVSLATLRKETSELSFDYIKQRLVSYLAKSELAVKFAKEFSDKNSNVLMYVEKCAELCWLMSVQSPPIFLDIAAGQKGSRFNRDTFREYTAKGKTVAFVVWPPLYIKEKGGMLCKGIAQGK